jgi:peptide subunit release factor RF-3
VVRTPRKTIMIDDLNLRGLHRIQAGMQTKSEDSISLSRVCNIAFEEWLKRK